MKKILTKIYNEPKKPRIKKVIPKGNVFFKTNYINGATCEILGESAVKYNVKFIDVKTEETIHQDSISVNCWIAPNRKWYTKWRTIVTEEMSQKEIFSEELNLKDKKVLVSFHSSSLGDNIAWVPYIEEFRKKHDCEVSCFTYFNNLFEKEYPKIKFVPANSSPEDMYASYQIGWFDNWENKERNPNDLRTIPLQQTASDILGLEHKEIKTKINIESPDRPIKEKYVCISTSSTAGCKHWQNPTGWQETVDYLNALGYKVVVVQKEALDWMDLNGLENVTHPSTDNIQEAITWLYNCDFFIGIGSGISWLAWALGKRVILNSGFSEPFVEFETPHRIINKKVCHGCWNNQIFLFDKGDWDWCPIHKGTEKQFECTKSITFDMVRKEIQNVLFISGAIVDEQKFWNGDIWERDGEEWSDQFGNTEELWKEYIGNDVEKYLSGNIVEIAVGHGRMTNKLLEYDIQLKGIDMNKNCVDFCSNRFSNASFFLNDGLSLPMIEDNSTNFVFSWDSFVHMHKNIVEKYLSEILRILVLGGHACIHHANFLGGTDFFTKNRHGRANLTPEEFSKLCKKYSLEIIQQKPITFEETDRLHPPSVSTVTDIISIVKKVKELDKKSLKIGLQILAYNCKEAFPRLIEPWAKLKEELNFKFWVHSRQFRIYEEMGSEDVNAETLKMLKTDYSELIDCLSVPEETLSDHESRSLCLEFFEKEDVDLIWMLDADEFYTEQQIRNIIDFIKNNSQFDWFSIQLKNYVVDESTWEDFAPLRVIRAKRHGGIREYYWDNHFSYKDDTEYRAHPNKTIPKDIAFPDHYTWTNTMNTTGPKHIKEKIEYQERFYSDGCGYRWNEEKQSIEVNKDNR